LRTLPGLPIIILTAHGSIPNAVEAMQRGAFGYLTKPFDDQELKATIEKALSQQRMSREIQRLKSLVKELYGLENVVARSPAMQRLFQQIAQVSDTDATILLFGETGTGKEVMARVIPAEMLDSKTKYHINPTGRFVVGGPHGDTGLTGRKIIVDTYGGWGRHGGGAFSGKDATKVDRSAAYMGRYVAKNIVAAGLAEQCEVQLAYAIGVADPVSVRVDTFGTATIAESKIAELVREHFPLTPKGIIEHLKLRRPIFLKTAEGGHFGRSGPTFSWEATDKAKALKKAAK